MENKPKGSVKPLIDKLDKECLKNEQWLMDHPDTPINTILEMNMKQGKIQACISWLVNIENLYNPPSIIQN